MRSGTEWATVVKSEALLGMGRMDGGQVMLDAEGTSIPIPWSSREDAASLRKFPGCCGLLTSSARKSESQNSGVVGEVFHS